MDSFAKSTTPFLFRTSKDIIKFIDSLSQSASNVDTGYPKYNIGRVDDNTYVIELAVAGFSKDQLSIKVQRNELVVSSNKPEETGVEYIHKGIAGRNFSRTFTLADEAEVGKSKLVNGILQIFLTRVVKEDASEFNIEIQ